MPSDIALQLGSLTEAVDARLAAWEADGIARHIWAKDPTVWAETDLPELTDRLGWLTLPGDMAGAVGELEEFAAEVAAEGIRFVVLLGMGGSSLAPETFQATFGNADTYPELIVLDSTHPDAVAAVGDRIELSRTLFIVASKSGTTLETLSFFRYFWNQLVVSRLPLGAHFVALTDPGSTLEDLAAERGFRRVFTTPPEVGGRYSALTYFGLLPAALIGANIGALLASGARAAQECRRLVDNPGLVLGAVWGESALAGRDKLTLVTSPGLGALPNWLEQLVAESTGKDGTGIVPVAGEDLSEPGDYVDDRLFVSYELIGERPPTDALDRLAAAGHPVVRISLRSQEDLGWAMFTAEFATAAAGAALGIHPFNQPDVQMAKELARQAMAGELAAGGPIDAARPEDAGRLGAWLTALPERAYIGISAYVPMTVDAVEALQGLRHHLRHMTKAATSVGFGPRFLHSTGQLHKGGPSTALFLQLVDEPSSDVPVPETDFTFARLIAGQAEGDYRALQGRGQTVLRIQLGSNWEASLDTLLDTVSSLG